MHSLQRNFWLDFITGDHNLMFCFSKAGRFVMLLQRKSLPSALYLMIRTIWSSHTKLLSWKCIRTLGNESTRILCQCSFLLHVHFLFIVCSLDIISLSCFKIDISLENQIYLIFITSILYVCACSLGINKMS